MTPNIDNEIQAWIRVAEISERSSFPLNVYIYEAALEHGMQFQSVSWRTWKGRGYRRMPERQCFFNAATFMNKYDGLTYCEGLAWCGHLVIHHAWCVTEDGRVVDPTWRQTRHAPVADWEYLGIPFEYRHVLKHAVRHGYYGLMQFHNWRKPFPAEGIAELDISA